MRVLVTGATGFVGRHLVECCAREGAEVVGLGRRREGEADPPPDLSRYLRVDLRDGQAAREAVASVRPERIFHLAAEASVAASWASPSATIESNLASALGLLEAVRRAAPEASVLVACSAEEYGVSADESEPVGEDHPLRPRSPYGVSKAAVDLTDAHRQVPFPADVDDRRGSRLGPGRPRGRVQASP